VKQALLLLALLLGGAAHAQVGDAPPSGAPAPPPAPPPATVSPTAATVSPKDEANTTTNASAPPIEKTGLGFDYGSYGRVGVGTDLRGHSGYGSNVVSHGTRLELAPYIELNFYYTGQIGADADRKWRVVLVPAFAGGDLFHYTGSLTSHLAIRNAYAEVDNAVIKGLTIWAGSRMYRGDDIYQFNYWPLDNLNTVGGGLIYQRRKTIAALHVGLNRLDDIFQYQTLDTPPRGLGPAGTATVLDRPRLVTSFKLTQGFWRPGSPRGAKISIYGEFHAIWPGEETDPSTRLKIQLPSDFGWVAGTQLSGWLRDQVFLNLWLRVAGGLATYGDLSVPQTLDHTTRVTDAREIVGALSGNYESKWFGMMMGAYIRRFIDPTDIPFNPQSYTEGIIAVRPTVYLGKYVHVAAELSYQRRVQDGIDPYAGRVLKPDVFRFSLMPILSPTGRGTYARPHLYLVYTVSALDQDARDALYDPLDFRYGYGTVHYLGGGVEWWFNSSYR
jgi:maltoporin